MSKEKVERYKEYKKNKDKILKKEKRNQKLGILAAVLVGIVFVGWLGWSVYHKITTPSADGTAEVATTTVDFTEFDEFYNGLNQSFSNLE